MLLSIPFFFCPGFDALSNMPFPSQHRPKVTTVPGDSSEGQDDDEDMYGDEGVDDIDL